MNTQRDADAPKVTGALKADAQLMQDVFRGMIDEPASAFDFVRPMAESANPMFWFGLQQKLVSEHTKLLTEVLTGNPMGPKAGEGDRRFRASEWEETLWFRWLRDSYLVNSGLAAEALENADLDEDTREKLGFYLRVAVEAASPANYPMTNPEAIKHAIETRGESMAAGARNLLEDLEKGYISLTDEAAFQIGVNIAASDGEVIYENEVIQLIQYRPLTEKVHERPLLIIPPFVNKFYIMDLEPEASYVRWCVEQGHRVFLTSFVNPGADEEKLTYDDYIERGVIKALEVAREVTGQPDANVVGFCSGGVLTVSAMAPLIARGQKDWVRSLTIMTAPLDLSDPGEIGVYMDSPFMRSRARSLKNGGVMQARDINAAFSMLKADDLVWANVSSRYLKGEKHRPFGLLFWNSDPAGLPGPMFAWFLEHTYIGNKLIEPGAAIVCGAPLDMGQVDVPVYAFAAIEDHIVPWKTGYDSARRLGGNVRFCLGGGGHIAGSMNPASKNRRNHWLAEGAMPDDADTWFASAQEHQGSWWNDWGPWVARHGGPLIEASPDIGSDRYEPIEPAPGRYVRVRAV